MKLPTTTELKKNFPAPPVALAGFALAVVAAAIAAQGALPLYLFLSQFAEADGTWHMTVIRDASSGAVALDWLRHVWLSARTIAPQISFALAAMVLFAALKRAANVWFYAGAGATFYSLASVFLTAYFLIQMALTPQIADDDGGPIVAWHWSWIEIPLLLFPLIMGGLAGSAYWFVARRFPPISNWREDRDATLEQSG